MNDEEHEILGQKKKVNEWSIGKDHLQLGKEMIVLDSPIPLKSISAGVTGAGMGCYQRFVNRHVDKEYNYDDHKQEMAQFLKERGFDPNETVGMMMTAVKLSHATYEEWLGHGFSIFIVVTAGTGNAVDASLGTKHLARLKPGTINTWVFVNGKLTNEAFIQSIVTATEAKTKALHEMQIIDPITQTLATGTSTDSILIASSQRGRELEFAGSISDLGALIGQGVFSCTKNALKKTRREQ